MKRQRCSACLRQRSVERLIIVTLGMGTPELPPETQQRFLFCQDCLILGARAHFKQAFEAMLSPFTARSKP